MTIGEVIAQLTAAAEQVGEDADVAVVRVDCGENDYIVPSYVVAGDFEDQDGNTFKCAIVGEDGGEEFTKCGVPHYKWQPKKDKVKA